MDAFSDKNTEVVVVMTSSQVGKTEILNNVVGNFIDVDPAPMLIVQPTLEMAHAWSKDRLDPMLRDTPALNKIIDVKKRDGENTILHKRFPGGQLTIAGSNSPSSLASRPVRVVLLDEVDRYDRSAGKEGDPAKLAIKRTTAFYNKKIGYFSTPTVLGSSRIHEAYQETDQRVYKVPCPHCGEFQQLTWSQIAWEADDIANAYYVCVENGCIIEHHDKIRMLRRGIWEAQKPFNGKAGFFINELYSPWVDWATMAANFLEARKLPEQLKVFVNTSLAELWDEERAGEGLEADEVANRAEKYNAQVPSGVYLLTASVDVQDDRLEIEVKGWGMDEENWSIAYIVLHCDPGKKESWNELDDILEDEYKHELGVKIKISCTCIDSGGHYAEEVYQYCKKKAAQKKRVYAIKGSSQRGQPIVIKWSRNNSLRVKLFMLGVDTAKETIYSRLKIKNPGAGYFHFPLHYDDDYFDQLTSEKKVQTYERGRPVIKWMKPKSRRNEALDLNVYNLAAYKILKPSMQKVKERFLARVKKREDSEPVENVENRDIKSQIVKRRKVTRRKTGFVKKY